MLVNIQARQSGDWLVLVRRQLCDLPGSPGGLSPLRSEVFQSCDLPENSGRPSLSCAQGQPDARHLYCKIIVKQSLRREAAYS